jgi:hypothetical protein
VSIRTCSFHKSTVLSTQYVKRRGEIFIKSPLSSIHCPTDEGGSSFGEWRSYALPRIGSSPNIDEERELLILDLRESGIPVSLVILSEL